MKGELLQLVNACLTNIEFYKTMFYHTHTNQCGVSDLNIGAIYIANKGVLSDFYYDDYGRADMRPIIEQIRSKLAASDVIWHYPYEYQLIKINFKDTPPIIIRALLSYGGKNRNVIQLEEIRESKSFLFGTVNKTVKTNHHIYEIYGTLQYIIESGTISAKISKEEFDAIIKSYKDNLEVFKSEIIEQGMEADRQKIRERLAQYSNPIEK